VELKDRVAAARWWAQRQVNTELLRLSWQIGDAIRTRQQAEGWGTRVIDRLASDLRAAFPGMRGLSQRNLVYMRTFAAAFPGGIAQQPVARLPWGHVTVLLDKLTDPGERGWYAAAAVGHGWSRAVLANQIMGRLHARSGSAPSNFTAQLPAADSELAQQLTRDPYVLDFLDVTAPVAERNLEAALVGRLQAFLLELGHGFAFLERQYRFEVDGEDVRIDLLFFNWVQSRFVVIELKAARFRPEFTGQLGFYVAWVDENLRDPPGTPRRSGPAVRGTHRQRRPVLLAAASAPLAVADYTYDTLPAAVRAGVPTDGELLAAVTPDLPGNTPRSTTTGRSTTSDRGTCHWSCPDPNSPSTSTSTNRVTRADPLGHRRCRPTKGSPRGVRVGRRRTDRSRVRIGVHPEVQPRRRGPPR